MYDPASPNNYRAAKLSRWKRARDAAPPNDMARLLAAAGALSPAFAGPGAPPPADGAPSAPGAPGGPSAPSGPSALSALSGPSGPSGPGGGAEAVPLHLSAEEVHRLRVRQSAAMGIRTAVQMERDELEAARKAKIAAGADRKSRIGEKLGKLMEVAAAKGAEGSARAEGAASDAPPTVASAPLFFQRSELAAGGYVVKEATGAPQRKQTLQGKPSSTILIRFLRDGPSADVFTSDAPGHVTARITFLEGVQEQCGRFGVVRSVRYAILSKEELLKLSAGENVGVNSKWIRETIRIFVRFDTVANAFKAIEELQKQFSHWCICFFPTQLFDAGNLGPTDGESLCVSS